MVPKRHVLCRNCRYADGPEAFAPSEGRVGPFSALPERMAKETPRRSPLLLVLGPAADLDEVRRELASFELVTAPSTAAAASALRASPIEAAVVSAEAPTAWIVELLAAIDRIRPGIPVLAVRHRNAEESPGWRARGVGVLRQPLLPDALARSVSAVLGLRHT